LRLRTCRFRGNSSLATSSADGDRIIIGSTEDVYGRCLLVPSAIICGAVNITLRDAGVAERSEDLVELLLPTPLALLEFLPHCSGDLPVSPMTSTLTPAVFFVRLRMPVTSCFVLSSIGQPAGITVRSAASHALSS
jgi:hypothetical protein